jgi:hypothetical protein
MLRRRAVAVQPLVEDGVALPLPSMPPAMAAHGDSIVIPLTAQQKTVAHLTVDVAFRYSVQADVDALRLALSKVLVAFPVLAGRAVRQQIDDSESELALCVPRLIGPMPAWAFVSFIHAEASDEIEPPSNGIAPDNLFDLATTECIPFEGVSVAGSKTCTTTSDPMDDSKLGRAPLTRIKVTSYKSGCQIIALSINHILVDAGSIGLFWCAWSEQYRSCRYGDGDFIDAKVTFDHPIFSQAEREKEDESNGIPDEWKELLPKEIEGDNPFDESSAGPTSPTATCTIYCRTAEEIKLLRREMFELHKDENHSPPFLSSNDVLCGEVCRTLDATSILLCMNWRPVLERSDFFGYALLFLYVSFANAMYASVACRRILGWSQHHLCDGNGKHAAFKEGIVRNERFVHWKMRNEYRQGKTHLIWNSWVGFFAILGEEEQNEADCDDRIPRMEMECCPNDIMMSEQMERMRISVASKGLSYAIVLPQPAKGVRIYFFGQPHHGKSLLSAYSS